MASYYVYSGAAGAGTGADWTNAYTTVSTAISGKTAGDIFYVAHDHVQTQASALTITGSGTETSPLLFYCVDRAGSVPPVAADLRATAQISTTGAFTITLGGSAQVWNGFIFSAGSTSSNASLTVGNTAYMTTRLINCKLILNTTSVTSSINAGTALQTHIVLENTTVKFGNVNQKITAMGQFTWRNTPSAVDTGGTVPTGLINIANAGSSAKVFCEGVDLSALGSGKSLIGSVSNPQFIVFKDCKLGASVTIHSNTTPMKDYILIRCDSGDTNYRTERHTNFGALTTDTAVVMTGGASDGTTPISYLITTNANAKFENHFESLPLSIWNETTGTPITVTIEGTWAGGAVPNNDDIWIDVEYLGTSGFPLAGKATCTKSVGYATGSALTAGSGTWSGGTTPFKMSATFTPEEKGPITVYVKAGKASSAFYFDPKPIIT
jgi:hypothetical protein